MAAENGIVGDEFGIDLPVVKAPVEDLAMEKNMAKFSRSKEYQVLKTHLEDRITYYQTYLPDGREVLKTAPKEADGMWTVSNLVIAEFKAVLGAYENARKVVEDAAKK